MNEQRIKNLIKVWWGKAFRESDHFSKFLFLWICLNAWLAYESGEDVDRDMIDWLKKQNGQSSKLVDCFETCKTKKTYVDSLKFFAGNSPFKDSRGKRPDIIIKDENDFENIVEAIYRIRCNLFHGASEAHEDDIIRQIVLSNNILKLEWVATLDLRING